MNFGETHNYYDVTVETPENPLDWKLSLHKKGGQKILDVKGEIAMNIYRLFEQHQDPGRLWTFNCYDAVYRAVGGPCIKEKHRHMNERGKKMYVQDALKEFNSPFVFQITGRDDFSIQCQPERNVFHAGLILGQASDGDIPIFDKNCDEGLHIRPWHVVENVYFHTQYPYNYVPGYVRCFPISEL